jgi:hypothetical protein
MVGCSYHNVIFNAERLYVDAERLRHDGLDSLADSRYREVVRKTGEALRARPDSEWADEALFLLGRTRVRLGELREARAALEEVVERSDGEMRGSAQVYLALVRAHLGDRSGAMEVVNTAILGPLAADSRAEAHLLRGRLLLAGGHVDQGWWDLDRAIELDPAVRVEAGLERLAWTIAHDDRERARQAATGLLLFQEAGTRLDTIGALVASAAVRWGPGAPADLLAGAGESTWDRVARGRIALERARWLDAAGDTAAAANQAFRVAGGLGVSADEARLQLATWRMARARDLAAVFNIRRVLLPSAADDGVARVLLALDDLEDYVARGLDDPLGWFAAGEVARDDLGADYVARGLFLAYADAAPDAVWAPKALLAALDLSPDEGDRAWLRGRLETHPVSPYVLAAYGGSAAGFQELEEALDMRLRELTQR